MPSRCILQRLAPLLRSCSSCDRCAWLLLLLLLLRRVQLAAAAGVLLLGKAAGAAALRTGAAMQADTTRCAPLRVVIRMASCR
jgi:hypothetical protein